MHAASRDHTGCDAGCPLAATTAGVDRRTFLAQGALVAAYAAAAAALAACGSGSGGGDPTSPTSISSSLKVSDYASLASIGGVAAVTLNGTPLAIVRTGTSSFLALSRICPHKGTEVNIVSSGFYCPNHGAQFSANGTWTGGQGTSSLMSYATTYDTATGTLTVG